jgi:hypothetical protein
VSPLALTFDDGPDARCTPELLDRLREAGAYLRPWDDGGVVSVPVLERPPLALLANRLDVPAGVS